MSEEENIAIETLKEVASDDFDTLGDDISPQMAQNILNVIDKQQKETEEYKKFKKDIVSKIMIWEKEELPDNERIIEMIDTLMSEVSRLEDIEDKKVEVAVDFIEEKRDKFWQDKIKAKIKELEITRNSSVTDNGFAIMSVVISNFEELLEEK